MKIPSHQMYIDAAINEAWKSSCWKSKRGVVIVKNGAIIARGHNDPPKGMLCTYTDEPPKCFDICSKYSVHAEQNAILDGLLKGKNLKDSKMYHMKIKHGKIESVLPVKSKGCVDCSKLILQLEIAGIFLQHDDGYAFYDAKELHELSLMSLGYDQGK